MTTVSDIGPTSRGPAATPIPAEPRSDHRGSWIPTWGMVTTRFCWSCASAED